MRFLCTHSLPANSISPEQLQQVADAMQTDAQIRGIRSFGSLSEGKIACIVDSPDRQTLSDWFQRMMLPVDAITAIEFEGDRGNIHIEEHAHA